MNISNEEKKVLLKIARNEIENSLGNKKDLNISFEEYPNLKEKAGSFVTLTKNKHLRGCIGYIYADEPLHKIIKKAAVQAAFEDPRFKPLTPSELNNLEIEISVLTPPVPINSYDEIIIGKHGLLLDEPRNRALLLPQVATEHNMDVPQFLSSLCQKGWLNANEWKKRPLKLQVFECIIFSEGESCEN